MKAGQRFEREVLFDLSRNERCFAIGPWFEYFETYRKNYCELDGIHVCFKTGTMTAVEVKLSHTPLAWWKVKKLYIPVMRKAFGPAWQYRGMEIVKHYEHDDLYPEPVKLVDGLDFECEENTWPVWRWPI